MRYLEAEAENSSALLSVFFLEIPDFGRSCNAFGVAMIRLWYCCDSRVDCWSGFSCASFVL